MTLKEQFDAMYEFRQLFNECGVAKPKAIAPNYTWAHFVSCEAVTQVRTSIDYFRYFKLHTINLDHAMRYRESS